MNKFFEVKINKRIVYIMTESKDMIVNSYKKLNIEGIKSVTEIRPEDILKKKLKNEKDKVEITYLNAKNRGNKINPCFLYYDRYGKIKAHTWIEDNINENIPIQIESEFYI